MTVPMLTEVRLQVLTSLSSKISKTGNTFPIRLAEPILIGGITLVPSGTTGVGEVVHAKSSGGGGSAGELVVAARYLNVAGGKRLRLRSMRILPVGRSNIDKVNTLNVAGAATFTPVALVGFLIKGGQVTIPAGTIADAKTAEVLSLAPSASAAIPGNNSTPQIERK